MKQTSYYRVSVASSFSETGCQDSDFHYEFVNSCYTIHKAIKIAEKYMQKSFRNKAMLRKGDKDNLFYASEEMENANAGKYKVIRITRR